MNELVQEHRTPSGQPYPDGMTPPVETLDLAKNLLSAHHAASSAKRQRQHADTARIQEKARALALGHIQTDGAGFRQLEQERRQWLERHSRTNGRARKAHAVSLQDVQPLLQARLTLAGAPYDFDWVSGVIPGAEHADRRTGDYGIRVGSLGGENTAAAGVGFWFFSGAGNPLQRFAALIDYSDTWQDSAAFYAAHNSASTRLWVFGASEKDWVARSDQTPSWSDGVGWLEEHGNAPDGEGGTVANQTFFHAAPNSWYQCWIWSTADVYADGGFWGFSSSWIDLEISVQLGILGSLG